MASAPAQVVWEVVRPEAQLRKVVDADTYDFLVNWKRRHDWRHATLERLRLRDYSAREHWQVEERDASTGDLVRLNGHGASQVAESVLREADCILVEHQGIDSFGRDVCWVWIDGESLGARLCELKAVKPGKAEG